jgi:hypothetical protein
MMYDLKLDRSLHNHAVEKANRIARELMKRKVLGTIRSCD